MSVDIKQNILSKSQWTRIFHMLIVAFVCWVMLIGMLAIVLVQMVSCLLLGKDQDVLRDIGHRSSIWFSQAFQFLTYSREAKPFPFVPFPPSEDESTSAEGTEGTSTDEMVIASVPGHVTEAPEDEALEDATFDDHVEGDSKDEAADLDLNTDFDETVFDAPAGNDSQQFSDPSLDTKLEDDNEPDQESAKNEENNTSTVEESTAEAVDSNVGNESQYSVGHVEAPVLDESLISSEADEADLDEAQRFNVSEQPDEEPSTEEDSLTLNESSYIDDVAFITPNDNVSSGSYHEDDSIDVEEDQAENKNIEELSNSPESELESESKSEASAYLGDDLTFLAPEESQEQSLSEDFSMGAPTEILAEALTEVSEELATETPEEFLSEEFTSEVPEGFSTEISEENATENSDAFLTEAQEEVTEVTRDVSEEFSSEALEESAAETQEEFIVETSEEVATEEASEEFSAGTLDYVATESSEEFLAESSEDVTTEAPEEFLTDASVEISEQASEEITEEASQVSPAFLAEKSGMAAVTSTARENDESTLSWEDYGNDDEQKTDSDVSALSNQEDELESSVTEGGDLALVEPEEDEGNLPSHAIDDNDVVEETEQSGNESQFLSVDSVEYSPVGIVSTEAEAEAEAETETETETETGALENPFASSYSLPDEASANESDNDTELGVNPFARYEERPTQTSRTDTLSPLEQRFAEKPEEPVKNDDPFGLDAAYEAGLADIAKIEAEVERERNAELEAEVAKHRPVISSASGTESKEGGTEPKADEEDDVFADIRFNLPKDDDGISVDAADFDLSILDNYEDEDEQK